MLQTVLNFVFSFAILLLGYALKKSTEELINMQNEYEEEIENKMRKYDKELYNEYPEDSGFSNWLQGLPDKTLNGRVSDLEYSRELMEKYFSIKQKTTPETTRYVKVGKEDNAKS